jgi:hypothetical protein
MFGICKGELREERARVMQDALREHYEESQRREAAHGRELRERYAGMAMQGLLAADENTALPDGMTQHDYTEMLARAAVGYADALIAALEEGE